MRACAASNAALIALLAALLSFAACTSGLPPPSRDPPEPESAPDPVATAAAPQGPATHAEPAAPAAPPAADRLRTAADCREIAADIVNDAPDGGVVMNNATTAADAGASDRMRPLIELVRGHRDGFRCCFDLWAKDHPGEGGKVVLTLALQPDGALKSAEVDASRSDVRAPEVTSCIVDLARSLTYPISPSGKETVYSHEFQFKARR
jgi:hypothetical protein